MDPYKVLGVRPGATQEEIKEAYRRMVKKYHPDKFAGTDLEEVAKEKMQEVNEAYSLLMGNKSGSGTYSESSRAYEYNDGATNVFQQVREKINAGDYSQAEALLNRIRDRNAEWHYLKGLILWRRGWYSEAYSHLQTAVNMDPGNLEYRNALMMLSSSMNNYRYQHYSDRSPRDDSDCCKLCTALYCADCLCECMGGDLISCC
ncbi:J domain-containing protein [Caldicoprobacter guelmensis]|uniref:J domain-containing protein n=1 Tax=Caldicoprobacter guelmensis TaxID=1170224 RepID=UPI0019579C1C|nr:DnaJ domain-containing protein [Caldicoprobacter guelmensis]